MVVVRTGVVGVKTVMAVHGDRNLPILLGD